LLLRLVHFVLPTALSASLATLLVFLISTMLATSAGLPEALVLAETRSSITVFATVCGILLLVFAAPPPRFRARGSARSGDWRPTILAGVLLLGLVLVLSLPLGRAFFEIQEFTLLEGAVIGGVSLLWALVLLFIWRWRLLERVLGISGNVI
jgi:cation-transporting ATPase E